MWHKIKINVWIFVAGEDGVESSGPGTDLQLEDGDCADEDGPISPGCQSKEAATIASATVAGKENEIHHQDQASEEEDEDDDDENNVTPPTNPSPSQITTRLNHPASLRDNTGPQTTDRYETETPRFVFVNKFCRSMVKLLKTSFYLIIIFDDASGLFIKMHEYNSFNI